MCNAGDDGTGPLAPWATTCSASGDYSIPTLILVSMLVFGLQQLLPGDPRSFSRRGPRSGAVSTCARSSSRQAPLPIPLPLRIGGVLRGDLGESLRVQKPVLELVLESCRSRWQLASMAIVIAILIGVTAGVISAVRDSAWTTPQRVRALGPFHAQFLARHPADPASSRCSSAGCPPRLS